MLGQQLVCFGRRDVILKTNDTHILGKEALKDDKHIYLKKVVLLKHNPWNGQRFRDLDISRQTIIIMVNYACSKS